MKCYKVVRNNGDSLFVEGKYKLHYEIGKRIKCKIGKIFVTKTLEEARVWRYHGDKIYECECVNLQKVKYLAILNFWYKKETDTRISNFWAGKEKCVYKNDSDIYFCDELTVIKEVQ